MPFQLRAFLDDFRRLSGWKLKLFFAVYYTYVGLWLTVSTRLRLGTHVLDEEWDLLVVLDTCRADALRAVADEYDFLDDVGTVTSLGSTSIEWLSQTFDREHADVIGRTAYVTGKLDSQSIFREGRYPPAVLQPPATWPAWDVVDADDFGLLAEVWEDGSDERLRVVPPRALTDRAVRVGRTHDHDRLVVHYMQPHTPYISALVRDGVTDETVVSPVDRDPFSALKRGTVTREAVWERYLDNLRLVLDDVALLLENVDAERVVITADHGEGFGEYGVYEHPVGCPAPTIKRVPWAVTTASDTGSYVPEEVADPVRLPLDPIEVPAEETTDAHPLVADPQFDGGAQTDGAAAGEDGADASDTDAADAADANGGRDTDATDDADAGRDTDATDPTDGHDRPSA
jgi:hypothetical protein